MPHGKSQGEELWLNESPKAIYQSMQMNQYENAGFAVIQNAGFPVMENAGKNADQNAGDAGKKTRARCACMPRDV